MFTPFDTLHIRWLIGISMAIIILCFLYKRQPHNRQRLEHAVAWALLLSEIVKQLYLWQSGQYTYWSPPLHLCGLGIFIVLIHSYKPQFVTATWLYSLTLPGAAIALLFPGWTNEPVGSFLHVHSFIFHALLVGYVCMLLVAKQLATTARMLYVSVLFLLITVPLTYLYNVRFHTNFMFLNKPVKGTPLQWLYDAFGASGYIVSLCVVLACIWLVLYSLKRTV